MRTGRFALGRRSGLRGWFEFLRHDLRHHMRHHMRAQLGVGRENAVVRAAGVRSLREAKLRGHQTDQVQPRPRHQRRQPLHELQRRHHQVGGAVTPSGLELEHDLAGGGGLHAFVGQRRRLGVRSCIDASPSFRPASPDVPPASNRVCRRAAPGDGAR